MDYHEQKRRADETRQKQLRYDLLVQAQIALGTSPDQFCDCREMFNFAASGEYTFDTEGECITLCRELAQRNYLEEKMRTIRAGEKLSVRHLRYKLTATGTALLEQHIPPDALVADDRLVVE